MAVIKLLLKAQLHNKESVGQTTSKKKGTPRVSSTLWTREEYF